MALTPMMKQYLEVKEKNKDCILFFRLGDFYEMFFEDAETAARELELVLTGRDCGLEKRAPMCGVPYHAANTYISRLIIKGYKVAICEQLEDPSQAKGIVKRDVIKIYTPGTYSDSSFLEETKNNYLMSLYVEDNLVAMSFADVSTGDFQCTYSKYSISAILDEISKFIPKEIVVLDTIDEKVISSIRERFDVALTEKSETFFIENACLNLSKQFADFNTEDYEDIVIKGCNGLLNYIIETQKTTLIHINKIDYYHTVDYLSIDINSRRNLELTETLRDKAKKGSLLWVLDKTATAMGGRLLRKWVEQPLIQKNIIEMRQNAVEEIMNNIPLCDDVRENLRDVYDIERLAGKISSKNVNAKELLSLKNSIGNLPAIKSLLKNFNSDLLKNIYDKLDCLEDIYSLLDNAILASPSLSIKEGGIIKDGYNNTIDELRMAKSHGKQWIASLEEQERTLTGIKSLKVKYNKVFGYYIEITKSNLDQVPENRYIRKQTLANCERYITPELKEVEEKILGAQEKLMELEYNLFIEIRDRIEKEIYRIKGSAKLISEIDVLGSLAVVALENNYCKPEIKTIGELYIKEGRHPVVEKMIPRDSFVSNDTVLDNKDQQLLLITGPNMAGKSTYMRQVALINVLAQIGSFVPAKKASVVICDKIFTRIGASDDLAKGKSTFMVEMWEVANILNNATSKSLILLDEVGRGTSTYDGLSIAWSVIEYICKNNNLKSKTLFATHYHELTSLEGKIEGVKNYSIAVKKVDDDIIFLRKIIEGGADESYGIEVAKLAGIPKDVIDRAKEILLNLEGDSISVEETSSKTVFTKVEEINLEASQDESVIENNISYETPEVAIENSSKDIKQIGFVDIEKESLLKEISSIDILNMTAMEGFNKLYDIIKRAKSL
ncbi:DNA mismatch repair protein MutS [Clostridium botulinum]|uniref:DNA mismatch repair protein MutS n=1 Tax=Clostridium botulinum TaxID=1491 RepID=UPI0004D6A202|nr:DNA mismatch repair protein MutS [Clostridium botulinum]KEI04434.1 DNA mismatch repair protein MutS [Clostridium botulinum C/D str. BKT75002]KEI11343.1 DNA mismatch repair protein MutS [Clostridium botulinum C/D str. BKT2873]KGM95535.1 DNA mismatch repair protein MutS [Clostridium botulinum D str. CCUG 7971]KOC47781.1 DNA mismatch repair protein MutS [Clostridium botulinum]MCD3350618.1 DNA mismatch repair protein MutS [Clostridium botulinum D/C]